MAAKLIDSLDPAVDDDAEDAWSTEIELRIEQLRKGEIQTVPWEVARNMILDDHDDTNGM